jgi:hypothetical protein
LRHFRTDFFGPSTGGGSSGILEKKSLNSVGNNINNQLSPQLIEHNNKT